MTANESGRRVQARWDSEIRIATWAVVVATTAWTWFLVSRSWYQADDFLDMNTARQSGLTWHYLSLSLFGHFIPGFRLLYWVLAVPLHGDHAWVELFTVTLFAMSVALFARCGTHLFGRRWGVVGATAFFGTCLLATPSLLWFASLLETLPTVAASLGCLYVFLLWRRSRNPLWLLPFAVVYAAGLSFYEIMLVFPLVPVLLELLFLGSGSSLRSRVVSVVRQWPAWLALALPMSAYLWYYVTNHYSSGSPGPTIAVALGTYAVAWLQAVAPSLFGHSVYLRAAPSLAVIIGGQLLALVVVVVAFFHNVSRTLRALVFLFACFVVYLTPVALDRSGSYGTGVGRDFLYLTPFSWLLPLFALLAWYPISTEPAPTAVRRHANVPVWRGVALSGGVAVLIVLAVAGQWSLSEDAGQPFRAVRSVATNFNASVTQLDHRHADFFVYDTKLPQDTMPLPLTIPWDLLSQTVGPLSEPVTFSQFVKLRRVGYVALSDGHLVPGGLSPRTRLSSVQVPTLGGYFCLPARSTATDATFSLDPKLGTGLWTVGLASLSGGLGEAQVWAEPESGKPTDPQILESAQGHAAYVALPPTSISRLHAWIPPGGPFCGNLTVGVPAPIASSARAGATASG